MGTGLFTLHLFLFDGEYLTSEIYGKYNALIFICVHIRDLVTISDLSKYLWEFQGFDLIKPGA